MKILVTDGAERAALAATRSLGRGAQLHVVASTPTSLAGVSRWCATQHSVRDPLRDPTGFVSDVSSLASKLGIDVVLPVSDASCHALLPERARLGHTRLAAPSAASYTRLSDKAQISALARAEDLELPEGREAHGTEQALQVAVRLGWPVVLKPAHSVLAQRDGGQRKTGVVQVRGADELREAWPRVCGDGKGLVQRIVPGWGEGLFLLRWQGRTRAVFAHRRLREKPPSGGTSVLRESISADPQRLRRVEAILDAVGFDGVAMAEFKTDGRKTWLMEFNARLWGSLQLAIDAGVDFPRLLVDAVLGVPPAPPPEYQVGVRSRWLLGDLDHAIALARGQTSTDGRRGLAAALGVLLRPAGPHCRWEVLRREDPRPFLHELGAWWGWRSHPVSRDQPG